MTTHMSGGENASENEGSEVTGESGEKEETLPPLSPLPTPRTFDEAMTMSVKDLRAALQAAGLDARGLVEKEDLAGLLVSQYEKQDNGAKPLEMKTPSHKA